MTIEEAAWRRRSCSSFTVRSIAAFTVLEPGDKAVPHRHTAAAIRFSTRAEGAFTIVNGRRCAMREGDLVLTPPMCWHGHINASGRRTIWFDAANMPAICALDASFFEPGSRGDERFWEFDTALQANQMNHFLKNLAIIGGLFFVAAFGPGRLSVDKS